MLLLDTHALLWLDAGHAMDAAALRAIDEAAERGGVLVSVVSAWEIGMLVSKARISLDRPPAVWFERFAGLAGVRCLSLSPTAAIAASFLPEPFHGDPADRMLVASARELGVPLVTRDSRIHAYATEGHVAVVPC